MVMDMGDERRQMGQGPKPPPSPSPKHICQGISTRRQRSDLFGHRVKLPPVTISLTTQKGKGNPVKCFAQGHNKRTCRPISTLTLLNERQA